MSEISKHREPVTHYLKIYPEYFSAVCTGVKRAELRKNDRDYRVGDTLHLLETRRGSCATTGEYVNAIITHIADVSEWMPGYVLLSIELEGVALRERAEPVAYPAPQDASPGWKIDPEFINKVQESIGYDEECECWEGTPSMEMVEAVLLAASKLKAPPAPDERYQQLIELYHAQEKRLFKLAQRIKGQTFDKYAHSPSQAIDVLEVAIFGENDEGCRAAMLAAALGKN